MSSVFRAALRVDGVAKVVEMTHVRPVGMWVRAECVIGSECLKAEESTNVPVYYAALVVRDVLSQLAEVELQVRPAEVRVRVARTELVDEQPVY